MLPEIVEALRRLSPRAGCDRAQGRQPRLMDAVLIASLLDRDWPSFVAHAQRLGLGQPQRTGTRLDLIVTAPGTTELFRPVLLCEDYDAAAPLLDFADVEAGESLGGQHWPRMSGAPYNRDHLRRPACADPLHTRHARQPPAPQPPRRGTRQERLDAGPPGEPDLPSHDADGDLPRTRCLMHHRLLDQLPAPGARPEASVQLDLAPGMMAATQSELLVRSDGRREAIVPTELLARAAITEAERGRLTGVPARSALGIVCGEFSALPEVPALSMPPLSAAPGILVAGEIVKDRIGASGPLNDRRNVLSAGILSGSHARWLTHRAKQPGCECGDPAYRDAHTRRHPKPPNLKR